MAWTYTREFYDNGDFIPNQWLVKLDSQTVGRITFQSYSGTSSYNWRSTLTGQYGNNQSLAEALNSVRNAHPA